MIDPLKAVHAAVDPAGLPPQIELDYQFDPRYLQSIGHVPKGEIDRDPSAAPPCSHDAVRCARCGKSLVHCPPMCGQCQEELGS